MQEQPPKDEVNSPLLQKRELGSTGLFVTPLCIGTAPLGSMPQDFGFTIDEDRALQILRKAFQGQINFIDTASNYGESEKRIGIALQELGSLPEGIVLQTKVDRNMDTGDFSGDQTKRSVERSLKLLHTNHLQIVYIHDPEHTTFENIMAPGGALEILRQYKEQGIIGHIGIAGGPIDLLMEYVETGAFEAIITHNRHTLLFRTAEPLIEAASKRNIAVLNAAPFGSGMLAQGSSSERYAYKKATPDMIKRLKSIEEVCKAFNIPLKAAALQFSLRNPRINSTIFGVSTPEQIDEAVTLTTRQIPDQFWQETDEFAIRNGDPES